MCKQCAGKVFGVGFTDLAYRYGETAETYFLEYIETPIPTYIEFKRRGLVVIFTGKTIKNDTVNLVFITRSKHGGMLNMGLRSHPISELTFPPPPVPEIHSACSLITRIKEDDFVSMFSPSVKGQLRAFLYELARPPCADHAPRAAVKRKMRA